jgi:hypothetical protein
MPRRNCEPNDDSQGEVTKTFEYQHACPKLPEFRSYRIPYRPGSLVTAVWYVYRQSPILLPPIRKQARFLGVESYIDCYAAIMWLYVEKTYVRTE